MGGQTGDPLEGHLEDIVTGLIVAGEMQYRAAERALYERRAQKQSELREKVRRREEAEERQAHERRIRAEQARVDRLLREAAAYRQANDIRAYVEDVRKANADSKDPVVPEELEAWASWALAQADRIDPILSRAFFRDTADSDDIQTS